MIPLYLDPKLVNVTRIAIPLYPLLKSNGRGYYEDKMILVQRRGRGKGVNIPWIRFVDYRYLNRKNPVFEQLEIDEVIFE